MPIFEPRLLRAKKGAPAFTPAMGSPTLVCAGAIAPPSAGGGALGVLLPPMKGSFPGGRATLIGTSLREKKTRRGERGGARAQTTDVRTYCPTASARALILTPRAETAHGRVKARS